MCFNSSANTPRLNLSSSSSSQQAGHSFPPIQLLGLEMLLHYFLGPEVVAAAARVNLQLTLGEGVGHGGLLEDVCLNIWEDPMLLLLMLQKKAVLNVFPEQY